MVRSLSDLSYKNRLRYLSLLSLSHHKLQDDLLLALRSLNSDFCINMSYVSLPYNTDNLKGHCKKFKGREQIFNVWSTVCPNV